MKLQCYSVIAGHARNIWNTVIEEHNSTDLRVIKDPGHVVRTPSPFAFQDKFTRTLEAYIQDEKYDMLLTHVLNWFNRHNIERNFF